jgi:hypothetical protein
MGIIKTRTRSTVIVIGADDIGSAIAIALHRSGFATVICDDVDPPWARRGMAFTNAWYLGNAELEGEAAVFCGSAKSIPSVALRERLIAATTWSWHGIAAMLDPLAIVDVRPPGRRGGGALKVRAPEDAVTMGIGAGFTAGVDVDVAIEFADAGTARPNEDAGLERAVYAPKAGRFATSRRIGDRVRQGEVVGAIGDVPVVAPIDGVLRGLTARGAAVYEGALALEVDPRGDPLRCFGIDDRARQIAGQVISAFAHCSPGVATIPESGIVRVPA